MCLENHLALVGWTVSNRGYLHPDIELAFSVERGYHARVVADRVLDAGSCVARCSMTMSLSVLNALHTPPFSCRGTMFPSAFLRSQQISVIQCFFLMEQWILRDKSWWAPYISTLPKPDEVETLYFMDQEMDLIHLKGTNLEMAVTKQAEMWKAQFAQGMDHLRRLEWPNAVNDRYTWELFRWSSTMFGSRSFTSQVLSNTLPADKARPMGHLDPDHEVLSNLFEDGFAVLLPLLDLLNYRPFSKVEWQAGINEVGLQILESCNGGQEVCNNYGPKDNDALMLAYGFSIPDNPFDHYAVGFRVPPDSPLAEARAWRAAQANTTKKSKTDNDYRYYIFNPEHPRAKAAQWLETSIFSHDLFESISILSANFRELGSNRFRSTGTILDMDPQRMTDGRQHRNLLHTLSQLRVECSSRIQLLRANLSDFEGCPKLAAPQKQQYAKLYRDSQLRILETAALLCHYCLLKAQHPQRDNFVLMFSAAAAEKLGRVSEAPHNVQKLIRRIPSAVNVRTLFSYSDAVELLPKELASKVRNASEIFSTDLMEKSRSGCERQSANSKEFQEKTSFTVLLAVLRKIYLDCLAMFPARFTLWMKDLEAWYPFDDPFWNGPTEEFLPTLESLVEAADQIMSDASEPVLDEVWSDPQMLSWGWNVQEEEGLFVDTGTPVSNGDGAVCRPLTYLLCIPEGRGKNIAAG